MKQQMFLFLMVLSGLFFSFYAQSQPIYLEPDNASYIYEDTVLIKAVNCINPTILRISNMTQSQSFDFDVSGFVVGGLLNYTLKVSDIHSRMPAETNIYWELLSGSTVGPRWYFIITDILKEFSLWNPGDYSQGSEIMTFNWEPQDPKNAPYVQYRVEFSTTDGFQYIQTVSTNTLTINTTSLGFPKEKVVSWRVKAFRDGGQNNIWSREWWNFIIPTTTDISDNYSLSGIKLEQNYPNPVSDITNIVFTLPVESHVKINIFDNQGILVDVALDADCPLGMNTFLYFAHSFFSGLYFYQLEVGRIIIRKPMIILK